MLYLGALKQINGNTYRAHHIIPDCEHYPRELPEGGIKVDAALPKAPRGQRVAAVYIDVVTHEVTCEYEADRARRGPGVQPAETAPTVEALQQRIVQLESENAELRGERDALKAVGKVTKP